MATRPRAPSHAALSAFEAAARTGSFLAAADELALTASAVSHRIRALERSLGVALFQRHHRAVVLTAAGEAYLARVRPVLALWHSLATLAPPPSRPVLRVQATPGIAATWLAESLARYVRVAGDLDVLIANRAEPSAILRGESDIAIVYGRDPTLAAAGLVQRRLLGTRVFPVASRAYLERFGALTDPAPLAQMTLLRHAQLSWDDWFRAQQLAPPLAAPGLVFDDALLMLEAAAQDAGVALIVDAVFERARVGSALVRLSEHAMPGEAYYLAVAAGASEKPWVRGFVRWLLRDAGGASGFEPV